MTIKVSDRYGHIEEIIGYASGPNGRGDALMLHLGKRLERGDAQQALVEALTGRDKEAVLIAQAMDGISEAVASMHPVFIEALAATCGGIDRHVAQALMPLMANEGSLEEDASGMAWAGASIRVQPANAEGIIFDDDGQVWMGMEFPQIVAAAMQGRRLGELIELAGDYGRHQVATCVTGDGETTIRLVQPTVALAKAA